MDVTTLYSLPFFIAALLIFIALTYVFSRIDAPGARYLAVMCFAAMVWTVTEGALYLGLDQRALIMVTKCQYIGIALVPPMILLFALCNFGYADRVNGPVRAVLLTLAGAVIFTVWTNPYHRMVFSGYETIDGGTITMLGLKYGPLWWVILGYHYTLMAVLCGLLVFKAVTDGAPYRSQALVILTAVASVWAAEIVYVTGSSPVINMDISSIAFSLVAVSLSWGVFRHDLLNLMPAVKSQIFRAMDDAILVFDEKIRLVDFNPAAQYIFMFLKQKDRSDSASLLFEKYPVLKSILKNRRDSVVPIRVDGEKHVFDVRVSLLSTPNGAIFGRLLVFRDITERKRAEEAILKSEERYRQIYNIAPAGILEIDYRTGRMVSVNDAICEYSGYSREELLAMAPMSMMSPDSRKRYLERLAKISSGEDIPQTEEYTFQRKDGISVDVAVNMRYEYEDGKIVGASVVAQDITERKRRERRIRQTEQRYKYLFDEISDIIFTLTPKGVLLSVNAAMVSLTGYEEDEMIGRPFHDFIQDVSRERFDTKILAAVNTAGAAGGTLRLKTRQGRVLPLMHRCTRVKSAGNGAYIIGIGRPAAAKECILTEEEKITGSVGF